MKILKLACLEKWFQQVSGVFIALAVCADIILCPSMENSSLELHFVVPLILLRKPQTPRVRLKTFFFSANVLLLSRTTLFQYRFSSFTSISVQYMLFQYKWRGMARLSLPRLFFGLFLTLILAPVESNGVPIDLPPEVDPSFYQKPISMDGESVS